jgi:hypothetical protein
MRTLGTYVLAASFLLRAGTSNDIAGHRITDFAYAYGFMPLGAILLYVIFAAMLWVWQPPGIGAENNKTESKMRWRTSPD